MLDLADELGLLRRLVVFIAIFLIELGAGLLVLLLGERCLLELIHH